MKVICQKCNATYAINDAAIPPKGARAQCPRCKNLQNVMRPEAAGAAPPPSALGAAPPPPAAAPADPFAGLTAGLPPRGPAAVPAPGGDPFADLAASIPAPRSPAGSDPFAGFSAGLPAGREPAPSDPFADLNLGAAPPPMASAPRPANRPVSDPFASLDVSGRGAAAPAMAPPPPAGSDPFADLELNHGVGSAAPAPAAPAPAAALGKCSGCGKLLTDPFDAALGTCESCRAKETPLNATPSAPPPRASVAAREPAIAPSREPATTGSRPLMVSPSKPAPAAAPAPPAPASFRPVRRRSATPLVLVGLVLLAGGGAFGAWKLHLIGPKASAVAELPAALRSRLGAWSLAFPDVAGDAATHLDLAHKRMLLDRPADYRAAESEYEKAALQAGDDRSKLASAVAGQLTAYLLGRGDSRDPDVEPSLVPLAEAASTLAPTQSDVLLARAYALAHQGPAQLEEARHLAQTALDAAPPEGKAEALLAMGALFIDSAQRSLEFLDRAIQANPNLQRAYYLRGLAAAKTGHDKQALKDFADRVKRDGSARDAALGIARVYAAVGDTTRARETLRTLQKEDPKAVEAQLLLATLDYQIDHNLRTAEAELAPLLDKIPKEGALSPVQLRILVHAAALAREVGETSKAKARLERALGASPNNAPALYQRVLVALAQHKPAEAHPAIDQLLNLASGSALEGARVEALAGRVSFAEGKPDEGVNHFRAAVRSSSIDLRAALLGAALAIKANRSNAAYELMKKAVEMDPAMERRHRGVSEYYESERSELSGTAGGFEDDQSSGLPIAYAGILQYHRGELGRAQRSFEAALRIEPDTAPALAYQAQIALDANGGAARAKTLAERALASDRTSVLAMFLAGRANEALGTSERARELYQGLLRQAPGFTSAMYQLASIEQHDGARQPAIDLLVKALFADPEDTLTRRMLFDLNY